MVDVTIFCGLGGMHLREFFVLTVSVTADADIVILVENGFATVTMHVDVRQLFVAQPTMEVTVPVPTQ